MKNLRRKMKTVKKKKGLNRHYRTKKKILMECLLDELIKDQIQHKRDSLNLKIDQNKSSELKNRGVN